MSHYYKDGKAVYEIPCSTKEGMRTVTVKDAKRLGLDVGVTTVLQQLDKPGLLRYRLHAAIQSTCVNYALEGPSLFQNASFEEVADKIIFQSNLETLRARQKGDKLHKELEHYFLYKTQRSKEIKFIEPVIKAVSDINNSCNWETERIFTHPLGYGGKIDLSCSIGDGIVIDFKSKDTDDLKKFIPYSDHLLQLAAYREGIDLPKARCYNIYFSSIKPGLIKVHEWSNEDLQRGFESFKCLLRFWQIWNKLEVKV